MFSNFRFFQESGMNMEEENDLDIEFYFLTDILDSHTGEESQIVLPPYYRCASHTLNLLAIKDTEKALQDKQYKKICRSMFAKLSKLWTKQNKSTQIADEIKNILGVYLQSPNQTRFVFNVYVS